METSLPSNPNPQVHINCTCGYNNSLNFLKSNYLTSISSDVKTTNHNGDSLIIILDALTSTYDFDSEDSIMLFVHRVCKELLISNVEYAYKLLREYIKFMALLVLKRQNKITMPFFNNDLPLIPSSRIFCLWRFHILYSSKYIEFCQKINQGERIHLDINQFFNPDIICSEENFKKFKVEYDHFLQIYNFYYGEIDNIEIWPDFHKNTVEYVFRFCLFPSSYKFLIKKHDFEEKFLITKLLMTANSSTLEDFRKGIVQTLNVIRESTGLPIEKLKDYINFKLSEENSKDTENYATEKVHDFFNGNISIISEIKSNKELWEKYQYCRTFTLPENFEYLLTHEMLLDYESISKLIIDYRRFLFLRCYRPKTIFTPSEEVDVVWHLHLNFTQIYIITMRKLLGYEYLHNPTKGGKKELDKHTSLYDNTLDVYKKLYGNASNMNWPGGMERFSQNPYWFVLTEKYMNGRLEHKHNQHRQNMEKAGLIQIVKELDWKIKLLMVFFLLFCIVIGGYLGHVISTMSSNEKNVFAPNKFRNMGGD